MSVPKPGPGRPAKPRLEEPYLGDRSTYYGGHWAYCRDTRGACFVKQEIWSELDAIEGQERLLAKSLLERLMLDATRGALRFGAREDVGVIARVPDLLELRLQVHPHYEDQSRRVLLRLYFAEPPNWDELMLALMFGRKPADGDPARVQDQHINEARNRYAQGVSMTPPWGI